MGSHGWLTVNAHFTRPEYNTHAHSTMQLHLLHNYNWNTISNYNTPHNWQPGTCKDQRNSKSEVKKTACFSLAWPGVLD